MRLFIAINVAEPVQNFLVDYMQKHKNLRVRWTKPENLHITVQFLGGVFKTRIPEITRRLNVITQEVRPFNLTLDTLVYAPPKKRRSMIWAVFFGSKEYEELVEKISKTLYDLVPEEKHGIKIMRKQRIPHVTLARFNEESSIMENLLELKIDNLQAAVKSIELWRSQLTPQGPVYTSLESFLLGV